MKARYKGGRSPLIWAIARYLRKGMSFDDIISTLEPGYLEGTLSDLQRVRLYNDAVKEAAIPVMGNPQ